MRRSQSSPSTSFLLSLIEGLAAKVQKVTGAGSGVLGTQEQTNGGGLGPAQSFNFDATAYTPHTTGLALILVSVAGTVSGLDDGLILQARSNGSGVGTPVQSSAAASGDAAGASTYAIVSITAGTPITPGASVANSTNGHTVSTLAGGVNVTIIELQTH